MRKYTEEGRIECFIGRSIDITIRNYINNPVKDVAVCKKISKTRIESGVAKGKNNPRYGLHCTEETKAKMRKANWKENSITNHYNYYSNLSRSRVEKELNKKLISGETVHHIDGDRSNNSIENLYVFPSRGEHSRYHCLLRGLVNKYILNV